MPKYKSESPIYRIKQRIYKINSGPGLPVYTRQLGKIIAQVENVLSWHRKVFVYVFDLHLCEFVHGNKLITELTRKLRFHFEKYYSIKRLGYAWCREQNKSANQHYHMAIIVNGSKIQTPNKLFHKIKMIWSEISSGGHMHVPQNSYYNIDRKTEKNKAEVIYRLSYQAKVWTKDKNTARENDYGTSRVKFREI